MFVDFSMWFNAICASVMCEVRHLFKARRVKISVVWRNITYWIDFAIELQLRLI